MSGGDEAQDLQSHACVTGEGQGGGWQSQIILNRSLVLAVGCTRHCPGHHTLLVDLGRRATQRGPCSWLSGLVCCGLRRIGRMGWP